MMADRERHDLSWDAGDVPISDLFDDTFYSRQDGQAEAAYVFLDGNGLPERWAMLPRFSIAELGFGTGLNFLETWRIWVKTRRPGQQLTFTSFERFPLATDDMARALAPWSDLGSLTTELLSRWSSSDSEPERCWQMDSCTSLHVVVGEAEPALANWAGVADVWYLDGFSPAKNPDMWSAPLMQQVFDHTGPGGWFATYTAAGWVRRNLEAAGFQVRKRRGHAGKREMMVGEKLECEPPSS